MSVLCFLTVVIVSARCSAESISVFGKTSRTAVANSTKADHYKPMIRLDNEALYEERGTFAIESLFSSVKIADESLPSSYRAANMIDVSQIKVRNQVFATEMEELGINIDGVVFVAKALVSDLKHFSFNNIEWMVLGKVYFATAGSSTGYRSLMARELFKEANIEIIDNEVITKWSTTLRKKFKVKTSNVFGKTLWLIENHNVHLADAVKMAFGSEYIKKRQLPIVDGLIQAMTVDKDVTEGSWKVDDDALKRRFAIESFTSSVKMIDESLPRYKHETAMIDVSQIKEHNQVLATRMEKLGINIDGVVAVAKALESDLTQFSLNNLEWMVLGKVYFKKAGSSTGYRILIASELFKEANMEIIDNEEIVKWSRMFRNFRVGSITVFGKMLWLIRHHDELNLDIADVAKMAFGSEYIPKRKLPISDSLIESVTEQKIDKDTIASLIRQDKEAMRKKIAKDKLPKKATRKYVGEESQEQPNKKRKEVV